MQTEYKRSELIDAGWTITEVNSELVMLQKDGGRQTVYMQDAGETLIPMSDEWFNGLYQ